MNPWASFRPSGSLWQNPTNLYFRLDQKNEEASAWSDHKNDLVEGFTEKYRVHTLVYYELHGDMQTAIQREKQLKKWNRQWKIELIENANPMWRDLWEELT